MSPGIHRIGSGFDLLQLHALEPQRYPYFLESSAAGTPHGRFDILFAFPQKSMWLDSQRSLHGAPAGSTDFLDALHRSQQAESTVELATELPFTSGWFVYLGYELAEQVEPSLRLTWPAEWPTAFATRMGAAIVRDRARNTMFVTTDSTESLSEIQQDIAAARRSRLKTDREVLVSAVREENPDNYIDAVNQAKRLIYAGEIYQANLSREWRAKQLGHAGDVRLFRQLRVNNPGPFAGLVRWKDNAIISSSPERLLRIRGNCIDTRPIAGTRPRGGSVDRDEELSQELFDHPKERAEHVMLIDLERNDLGRVCIPGSVKVDEYMTLETYAHVHHIVSNVTGHLRPGITAAQAMRAVFPGGTITGCPKVRCMEIISKLEQTPRGPYTGSFGYLDRSGNCDMNILIRTLTRCGDELSVRAGAGIVAESIPEREVEETRAKARGLLLALGADL